MCRCGMGEQNHDEKKKIKKFNIGKVKKNPYI